MSMKNSNDTIRNRTHVKGKVVPVITGANWEPLQNHSKMPQQHTEKAQTQEPTNQTVIFGTAYVLLEVLT
jgi:hypothetical protein